MRREFAFALLPILPAALAASQQASPPNPPVSAQTVYYAGPGVTAPDLLSANLANTPTGHCKHVDGTVVLSTVVDATGVPHNVYFLRPLGSDLDGIALRLVLAERFKPGTHDGEPSATVVSIEVDLKTCIEKEKNEAGQKVQTLRPQSVPNQKLSLQEPPSEGATLSLSSTSLAQPGGGDTTPYKVDRGISRPVIIRQTEAVYSDKARKERLQGACLISLIVDAHGMPQNLHLIRSLEPGLDQNALDAVRRYRFKPAMRKDGTPAPAIITVEVDFHLY